MAGGVHSRRVHGRGACMEEPCMAVCVVGETATAADGPHPTGMHSCLTNLITNINGQLSDLKACSHVTSMSPFF